MFHELFSARWESIDPDKTDETDPDEHLQREEFED